MRHDLVRRGPWVEGSEQLGQTDSTAGSLEKAALALVLCTWWVVLTEIQSTEGTQLVFGSFVPASNWERPFLETCCGFLNYGWGCHY